MFRTLRQLLFVFLISNSLAVWAAYIRGEVRYLNGQPADHVVIRLRSDVIAYQTETTTDPRGKFDFDGLPQSTYHLTIEGQGFQPYESHIDISTTPIAYETIVLQPIKQPDENLPPQGPVSALNDQAPPQARKELESGEKLANERKDLDGAVRHFRKAIQIYDKYPEAHLKLGLALLDMGKLTEAQSELQKSTQLDPMAPAAYLALGAIYNQEKRYPEAERTLTHGLELKPDVPDAQYELSKTYLALGRWQEAEPHAQKAAALQPDLAPVHVILGNIALKKRDATGALKEYQQYLKLDPNGPMAQGVQAMVNKLQAAPGVEEK